MRVFICGTTYQTTLATLSKRPFLFNLWGLNQFWPYWIANTIAWLISVLFAYITNKIWVFDSQTPTFRAVLIEMTSFFGFRLLSYFIDQGIMIVGISVLHGNDLIVKLIDQIIVVLLNWFFSKLFIFKDRGH